MKTSLLKSNLSKNIEDRVSARYFAILQTQREIRLAIMPKLRALRLADKGWERTLGRPVGTAKIEADGYAVRLGTMEDLATANEPRFAMIEESAKLAEVQS